MKNHSRLISFLLLTILGISYFTWVTYSSGKRLESTNGWVTHTYEVIHKISTLSAIITEIHADFKSGLPDDKTLFANRLNHKKAFLQQEIGLLSKLTADNPGQQPIIRKINTYLGQLIQNQQDPDKNSRFEDRATNYLMDSIRAEIAVLTSNEQQLLINRITSNQEESRKLFRINIACGCLFLVIAGVFIVNMTTNAARRNKIKQELLNSETKYRRLIEDAGVVMFTTSIKGDFTFVNHKVESVTGYSETEILHENFSLLVAPYYLPQVVQHYTSQYFKRSETSCIEFPIVTRSGTEKWVELDSVLIYEKGEISGFQCIVRDIHTKKMAEFALQKIELERQEYDYRLQSILDNTPMMIFIKDLDGKYLLVNKRFKETLGGNETLIGKTDYDIDSIANADRFKTADQSVIHTLKPVEVEETFDNNGKTQILMVIKFPLFDRSGKIFAVGGIANDITERVEYQRYLLETRKNAENAEKLQGEFLANMSHEIRTPMNGIIGMTNLLLQTPLEAEQERFLQIVRHSSDNLLFLINDILDLSKIKAGKMTIESVEFNIINVMETVIAPFRIRMKEKGIELITEIHPGTPELLVGDPYRLSQVLSNLFSNAIKFTQQGYIRFMVSLVPGNGNCTLGFSVEDTGIGIAPNKIDYIFESFAQASMDTSRKFGGTGLGLSITKQLIQLQNGSIEVSSILGKGTTFQFTIPFQMVQIQKVAKTEEKQVIDKNSLRGKKILIAEDNEINQMVISFTLKQAGIVTTIVNNGKEAVDLLESEEKNAFDLIIMDLQMPEMNGLEATAYIRNILKLNTPIIAMTASVLKDERILCFETGMNDYMSKPFKPAELFSTVSKFLGEDLESLQAGSGPRGIDCLSPYNLSNLYKMMGKPEARDLIGMFIENTPLLLNKIQTAVLLNAWTDVGTTAMALKSSIELLEIQEMVQDIIDVERMSRLNVQVDLIPAILNRLIEYFNTIKPLLEEETNNPVLSFENNLKVF